MGLGCNAAFVETNVKTSNSFFFINIIMISLCRSSVGGAMRVRGRGVPTRSDIRQNMVMYVHKYKYVCYTVYGANVNRTALDFNFLLHVISER